MNLSAVKELLKNPWEPKVYSVEDLVGFLQISPHEAELIVCSVNAGDGEGREFVVHHDLVSYFRDLVTIAEVPEHEEEISAHGHWLLEQGWGLDPRRKVYRWKEPSDPELCFTLRGALRIELFRQFVPDPEEDDIFDAEFEVRTASDS